MAIAFYNAEAKQSKMKEFKDLGHLIVHKEVIKEIMVEVPVEVTKNVYITRGTDIKVEDKIVYVPKEVIITREVPVKYEVYKLAEFKKLKYICVGLSILCVILVGALYVIG